MRNLRPIAALLFCLVLTLWGCTRQQPTSVEVAGMEFVRIAGGEFDMGSPEGEAGRYKDEGPVHHVRISRSYWMGKTEVTQGQWERVMGTNPSFFKGCGSNCPVEQVSWLDAVAFANAVSKLAGVEECYQISGETVSMRKGLSCEGYRLPTEAEWEYAARAGTRTALYTGELTIRGDCDGPELDSIAWYCGIADGKTQPVAQKAANGLGLYDMLGNVWEWNQDWYGDYPSGTATDPVGPSSGSSRVDRGGGWGGIAGRCRSAYRGSGAPGARGSGLGLRLARSVP